MPDITLKAATFIEVLDKWASAEPERRRLYTDLLARLRGEAHCDLHREAQAKFGHGAENPPAEVVNAHMFGHLEHFTSELMATHDGKRMMTRLQKLDEQCEGWRAVLRTYGEAIVVAAGQEAAPIARLVGRWNVDDATAARDCAEVLRLKAPSLAQADAPPLALSTQDIAILRVLAKHAPRALNVYDLETEGLPSRRTFSPRLTQLVEKGLVHKEGQRKGFTITSTGRKTLDDLKASAR